MTNVKVISGCEGYSLYIDDYRVAGNKPWGGGERVHEWDVEIPEIKRLTARIDELEAAQKRHPASEPPENNRKIEGQTEYGNVYTVRWVTVDFRVEAEIAYDNWHEKKSIEIPT